MHEQSGDGALEDPAELTAPAVMVLYRQCGGAIEEKGGRDRGPITKSSAFGIDRPTGVSYMVPRASKIRSDLVQRAKEGIRSSYYDDPTNLVRIADHIVDALWRDIDSIPVGAGREYRDGVRTVCSRLWDALLDAPNSDVEVANCGARIDIEFPLRLEALNSFSLFKQWAEWYNIRSVLVEVKNERRVAGVQDAKQIVGDVAVAQRGRFAFLIARSGFSRPAMRYMGELARQGNYLIVPLSHEDLRLLLRKRIAGCAATMELLRIRQSDLLRAA